MQNQIYLLHFKKSIRKLSKTWTFNQLEDGMFLLNKQPVTIENDAIKLSEVIQVIRLQIFLKLYYMGKM